MQWLLRLCRDNPLGLTVYVAFVAFVYLHVPLTAEPADKAAAASASVAR